MTATVTEDMIKFEPFDDYETRVNIRGIFWISKRDEKEFMKAMCKLINKYRT